ncbi:ABC transporter substrate-binding protein [Kineococcus rhizosphaerae]|uniref:Thiamine pyrimidine synthase n=1 Tax=Kineococcus rhizosphaerae TaxID=559628 RepID=A0A2T0QY06_9ACTN|nr:ABC transporter substrate-binding protein [Kineococcus rhizosphaerae]PRY11102.1 NitT/TauT family transport system substrate-binding protein [Kineococcus rhizosphaerae]
MRPLSRRAFSLAALGSAGLLAACGDDSAAGSASGPASSGAATGKLTVQMSWYPNAQSGGWYAAANQGLFSDAGLDVTLAPGGANISGLTLLTSNQVQIASMTAESYLDARDQGIPLMAVGADWDVSPTGVMTKKALGAKAFEDLGGKVWAVTQTSIGQDWVKEAEKIDFTTQQYSGSIAPFLQSEDLVQQAFPTNEVYTARTQGVDVDFFPYTDAGYRPYGNLLVATQKYLDANGALVKAVLEAAAQGWADYVSDVDVATATNADLKKANEQLAEDQNWFAWETQRQYVLGDRTTMSTMTADRWTEFAGQLKTLGRVEKDHQASDLFTNDFLPQIPVPTTLPAAPPNSYTGQA